MSSFCSIVNWESLDHANNFNLSGTTLDPREKTLEWDMNSGPLAPQAAVLSITPLPLVPFYTPNIFWDLNSQESEESKFSASPSFTQQAPYISRVKEFSSLTSFVETLT